MTYDRHILHGLPIIPSIGVRGQFEGKLYASLIKPHVVLVVLGCGRKEADLQNSIV